MQFTGNEIAEILMALSMALILTAECVRRQRKDMMRDQEEMIRTRRENENLKKMLARNDMEVDALHHRLERLGF